MYDQYIGHDIKAYAGYVKDEHDLLACSSGGIATALSRLIIERGGYVAGVTYSSDFMEAKYEITNTLEGIEKFRGSKYVEVQKGTIYKEIQTLLNDGNTVLFFGLPCVVAALRSYLKKDYNHLITVDLICHGPTLSQVHKDYITYLTNKYDSKIVEFSVKKKMGSWTPGYLYAKFDNGKSFCEQFYHTEYGYGFSVLAKKSCYSCSFRGNNRTGDIMIGDFWGANKADKFWNKNGVSSILVHTPKGNDLICSLKDIELYETSFERIVEQNPNIIHPRSVRVEKKKFEKLLFRKGLFYAVKHSRRLGTRIKGVIKKIRKNSARV
ncbi:MAG: Coenzyme F420 hydrogenase/dehydrogenase, beta subunit C-terminal domain [Clostridia bacterium]|nr:Coenzyme F420 hydrogenase/dehydrogenase, beta subunit C-terminal domain [Clostridia bacterium]